MTDAWFRAARWFTRWAVLDDHFLRPEPVSFHDDQASAQAAADELNTPRPAPQRTQQGSLFDHQEA